jgi:hypothetical protein
MSCRNLRSPIVAIPVALLLAFAPAEVARQPLASPASATRMHVEALAAPALEGRLAGSNGERLAGDYLVSQLQRMGALPLPGLSDYRIAFDFAAGTRDGGSSITVARSGAPGESRNFRARSDVQALSLSDDGEVTGEAVFAGYGIVVPAGQNVAYDSYAALDVKDKIVVVLRYFPEDAEPATKAILSRYADPRYKALAARQRGAKAMVMVTGPRSPNAGETMPMSFDTAIAGSGIVAASVSATVATAIFAAAPDTLHSLQESLDSAHARGTGFAMPGVALTVRTAVVRERRTGHNVVAYLPSTVQAAGVSKPWIAVGAHYDHLGHGDTGSSLARKDEVGKTHLGADDNASGAAAVLAVGAALAGKPRRRHLLLAFWSGEELGLLGSAAFVARPPFALAELAAYLNFDMVGRMRENRLTLQAVGTSPAWRGMLEQSNFVAGFDLQMQDDPYQPTDIASFNAAIVPSVGFFTGVHADYHRPTDTADKINYEGLDRVVGFALAIFARLDEGRSAPEFTKVDAAQQANRRGLRIATGTIPDYSSAMKGLRLSGVVGGGPADRAGLQAGDLIVEIAGQAIANIYDYTYALDILKIGQPAKVIYLRSGERRETMLIPAARR